MSLDIYLGQEIDLGGPDGPEWHEVYNANITHNLGRMWQCAGVYDALYESHGKTAVDILPALEVGCDFMLTYPDECKKHNAPNGWGLYEHAVPWLQKLIAACRRYPKATVKVSR